MAAYMVTLKVELKIDRHPSNTNMSAPKVIDKNVKI
jgi:hypothetical protein